MAYRKRDLSSTGECFLFSEREGSSKVRELKEKREAVDNGHKRSTSNVQLSTLKWRNAQLRTSK